MINDWKEDIKVLWVLLDQMEDEINFNIANSESNWHVYPDYFAWRELYISYRDEYFHCNLIERAGN